MQQQTEEKRSHHWIYANK